MISAGVCSDVLESAISCREEERERPSWELLDLGVLEGVIIGEIVECETVISVGACSHVLEDVYWSRR